MSIAALLAISPDVAMLLVFATIILNAGFFMLWKATTYCRRAEMAAWESREQCKMNVDNHLAFLGELARRQGWDLKAELVKNKKLPPSNVN